MAGLFLKELKYRGFVEWCQNVFAETNQAIISMDFAKRDDVTFALKDSKWDLCIVDEAPKMSVTPHRGDYENFRAVFQDSKDNLYLYHMIKR